VDVLVVQDVGAEAVADPARQEADRADRGHHQVALLHRGGAEVHAGRQVGQHPGLQFPVGDQVPHVRDGRAGGHRPVHPPDVVLAGHVDPAVAELAAGAREEALVGAVQQPVQPPDDGQFEPAQRLLGRAQGVAARRGSVAGNR
jgi:hypothetical protein